MTARALIAGAAIAGVAAMSGCASTPGGAGGEPITVEVRNDLVPPTTLTVWLDQEIGGRTMLGTVTPSQTRTFTPSTGVTAGEYRLIAETTDGTDIASRTFVVGADAFVSWDLSANMVTVSDS